MSEGYQPTPPPERPFAHMIDLPDDLVEAFEQFKLGILRHRIARWSDVSKRDVIDVLKSLIEMAKAPPE